MKCHPIYFILLAPGLLTMIISFTWAKAIGAEEVWGDALPFVVCFWVGFIIFIPGAIISLAIRKSLNSGTIESRFLSHLKVREQQKKTEKTDDR